ncbi:MAG TPA: GNAT family N-acetyltransferase [Kaistia sp.]|nr:GNAT family N-acetyltransferase [Kaistia sp.]
MAGEAPTLPTTLQIEGACLSAWPAIAVVHEGAWLWRFAHGYSKRSNAFQCLDPADDGDAEARIAKLSALSRKHGIEPVFRVTPLAGPGVVAALDRLGWMPFEESRVLAMDLTAEPPAPAGDIRWLNPGDPRWYRAEASLSGYDARTLETLKTLLSLIAYESKGIVVHGRDGTPAAAALAVNAGGIGVYLNVVADKARRRQGLGTAVMRAALGWTREKGATSAAIQVVSDNAPAIALYEQLGFVEQYRYHYRRPPKA